MSYYYNVYGINVKSEILIPELTELDISKREDIDVIIKYNEMNSKIKEEINNGEVAGYKNDDMWIYIKNVATYHIYNGNTVNVEPCENADNKMINIYIIGSVLGMILIQRNTVAIHGGGIVINNKGYVLTGHKGAGKSTLTTALRKKGYTFIADDVCSIKNGIVNKISPGFGYQKLCEDAMLKLEYDVSKYKQFRSDSILKYIVPAHDKFIDYEVDFAGIFEICVDDVDEVKIEEIKGTKKIDSLISNIFRIEMIYYAGGINPVYFKKCVDIAKSIKYYKLTRPKDVFSVNEQIEVIENIIYKDEIDNLEKLG